MSYSIATLNVNGLRDKEKRQKLFFLFKKKAFDVVFLQETRCYSDNEAISCGKSMGWGIFLEEWEQPIKGGGHFIKKKQSDLQVKDVIKDEEGRFISFKATITDDNEYLFTNIYSSNNSVTRKRFIKNITGQLQLTKMATENCFEIGDLSHR